MTTVKPDENGRSDFVSDGSHNIVTYYKVDKSLHVLRTGKPCHITGTDITIEHFPTDLERVARFKDLKIKVSEFETVPGRFL